MKKILFQREIKIYPPLREIVRMEDKFFSSTLKRKAYPSSFLLRRPPGERTRE